MTEIRTVPSIPFLGVTPDGRVMNMLSQKWLSCCDNGNGYKQVFVNVGGKRYVRYIHRLVAECYVQNPNNVNEVNHKDGNKANNWFWNLEWCTRSQNMLHALRTGLKPLSSEKQRKAASEAGKRTILKAQEGWKKWAQTPAAREQWIKNLENADRWGTKERREKA